MKNQVEQPAKKQVLEYENRYPKRLKLASSCLLKNNYKNPIPFHESPLNLSDEKPLKSL